MNINNKCRSHSQSLQWCRKVGRLFRVVVIELIACVPGNRMKLNLKSEWVDETHFSFHLFTTYYKSKTKTPTTTTATTTTTSSKTTSLRTLLQVSLTHLFPLSCILCLSLAILFTYKYINIYVYIKVHTSKVDSRARRCTQRATYVKAVQ